MAIARFRFWTKNSPLPPEIQTPVLRIYEELYKEHPNYIALCNQEGAVWNKYRDDVLRYKIKHAHELVRDMPYSSILEVGCATGFFLHKFPGRNTTRRRAIDISTENNYLRKTGIPDHLIFCRDISGVPATTPAQPFRPRAAVRYP